MCTVCGCGEGEVRIEGKAHGRHHHGHEGHDHHHDHDHGPHHHHDHVHDCGSGPAGDHAPGMSQARMVKLEKDILSKNNEYADANRKMFAERGVLALNLVSSPGSGKTTLLCRTIDALRGKLPIAVIEGDQQTSNDADRIRATGAPAIQVNTGKGCHLDAHMVGHAADHLDLAEGGLLLVENVGNLVCPAGFDLGEAHKVVVLSVTEGEDKPLKYPDMFAAADLMLLNKTDLLPHLDFDVEACIANARKVNPRIKVLRVSARTGEGMSDWTAWIGAARAMALTGHPLAAELKGAA
ncbi:hydrogenase nickel incorporation protein HypB [Mesorhizobium silamurunense]|uniref:hydrogenase nickel incorporation protein HypB n=1 Tax=Mesorhizobium silamurunense TaxID=499528 RepID=UPI0017827E49|nr:hydrogenase nickel incorporation protein HypB [Mesorhizobium silamurunense]